MQLDDFDFSVPDELIAQQPLETRSAARMLSCNVASGALSDTTVAALPDLLNAGDLVVLNDTRVVPARLFGHKPTGGRVEILIERISGVDRASAHIRASKSPQPGQRIKIDPFGSLEILSRNEDLYELCSIDAGFDEVLDQSGHVPLPPYINRDDSPTDIERYQTVFARQPGAVAAPTAGLHIDHTLLERFSANGIGVEYITLHVGAGTFQPVRVQEVSEHKMHAERYEVTAELCDAIAETKRAGGQVVAVGTTVVRSLESAVDEDGKVRPTAGETRLFIRPGFRFQVVDALLTNFHVPKSSLIMLVCAFGGFEHVMQAYKHAIAQRYRFFSYGDAMWLHAGSPG